MGGRVGVMGSLDHLIHRAVQLENCGDLRNLTKSYLPAHSNIVNMLLNTPEKAGASTPTQLYMKVGGSDRHPRRHSYLDMTRLKSG